jgi:adenylate cyclase class IV
VDQAAYFSIEAKCPARAGDFELSKEVTVNIDDPSRGAQLLEALGLRQILTLNKQRATYWLDEMCQCHIDSYFNNTVIVEIEAVSTSPEKIYKDALSEWAHRLELDNRARLSTSAAVHLIRMSLKAQL